MIRIATPITGRSPLRHRRRPPQLYLAGRRVAAIGALLMAHDHHDSRVCWRDLRTRIR